MDSWQDVFIHLPKPIRAFVKTNAIFFFIFCFFTHSALLSIFVWDRWRLKRIRAQIISRYSLLGLAVLNVRVDWKRKSGSPELPLEEPHLIVCNHLSYLDVLVLCAEAPGCFVTSQEIRETPFLGSLTQLAGCLYVERRNKKNIHNEIRELTEGLLNGVSVYVFPEATSTNGEQVLRFRRPLYNAAVDSETSVLPLCLNYKTVSGKPLDVQNRDSIFWYGDMGFISHLWRLSSETSVRAEVTLMKTVPTFKYSLDAELADTTHRMVKEEFIPCIAAGAYP